MDSNLEKTASDTDYSLGFSDGISEVIEGASKDDYRRALSIHTTNKNKINTKRLDNQYNKGIKNKWKVTKLEENTNRILVTPEIGGNINLGIQYEGEVLVSNNHADITNKNLTFILNA